MGSKREMLPECSEKFSHAVEKESQISKQLATIEGKLDAVIKTASEAAVNAAVTSNTLNNHYNELMRIILNNRTNIAFNKKLAILALVTAVGGGSAVGIVNWLM